MGSVASRTRQQSLIRTRGTDGEDEENEEEKQFAQQSSPHVSLAMRIYGHALESIFSMCNLQDLIQLLAVSRSWSAAVRSMSPIDASIVRSVDDGPRYRVLPPIASIISSPLLRHLAVLHFVDMRDWSRFNSLLLNSESIELLSRHAPNLTRMNCSIFIPAAPTSLRFPLKLSSLNIESAVLTEQDRKPSAADVNWLLSSIAALPALTELVFAAPFNDDEINYALLAACHSLTDVELNDPSMQKEDQLEVSDEQIEAIRNNLGHLQRIVYGSPNLHAHRFLQDPLPSGLKWQDLGQICLDAELCALLPLLPSLTHLDALFTEDLPHIDFLSAMPNLRVLKLYCRGYQGCDWLIPADALLSSMLPCTGLTELELNCGLNSSQMATLLEKLTKLKKLVINLMKSLESLQCLSVGSLPRTLEHLELRGLQHLPATEIAHVHPLKRLHTLDVQGCFQSQLQNDALVSSSPPTSLLPSLTSLEYHFGWGSSAGEFAYKRRGPSFEWTQQRLIQ